MFEIEIDRSFAAAHQLKGIKHLLVKEVVCLVGADIKLIGLPIGVGKNGNAACFVDLFAAPFCHGDAVAVLLRNISQPYRLFDVQERSRPRACFFYCKIRRILLH